MKKILTLITGLLLLSVSCTDWLEESPLDKVSSEYIYTNSSGINVALNGLYSLDRRYYNMHWDYNGTFWFYCADDLSVVRTRNDGQIYRASMTALGMPSEKWDWGYQIIDRASAIISNTPAIADMKPADKARIISEAKVIRAMTYFDLYRIFDNILFDTIPTTAANASDPTEFKPASKEQIFNVINSDLDDAIKVLSYKVNPGAVGKALALQLRAEAAMWTDDFKTAATSCDSIIASNLFDLVEISSLFGTNTNHKESLYAFQYDEPSGGDDKNPGGKGNHLPGMFSARFYELKDGYMIEDNVWNGRSLGWSFPNDYLKSLYDHKSDKRFQYFFYPDSLIGNNPAKPEYYQKPLPRSAYEDNFRRYHWSLKKYQDFGKAAGTELSYKDVMHYRLAHTYLLGAEAHMKLGNTTKALEYINKIRTRAGLANLTEIDIDKIVDEDAREFCFEGKRWFLLKRLGILMDRVNKYHQWGGNSTNLALSPMKDYMVRWPIPQAQIDAMGGVFPQNPGY